MQKLVDKISEADRNPAYPTTSISGVQTKKNLIGGIMGIIFWMVLLLLIIQKSTVVFGKSQVFVESFVERNQDKVQLYPNESIFKVAFYSYIDQKWIGYNDQKSYGFEVFVFHFNFWFDEEDFTVKNITTIQKMVPCQQFNDTFCIPPQLTNLTIECDIEKLGPDGCRQAQILSLRVIQCQPSDPQCGDLQPFIFAGTGFKNNIFDIFKTKTNQTIQISEISLDRKHQYILRLMISKLQIKTDQSIMPSLIPVHQESLIQTWFYSNQKGLYQSYFPNVRKLLLSIQFRRSQYTERYRRHFMKIDTMLGQVLGFTGLLAWIASLLCSGYNKYQMKNLILRKKHQIQTPQQLQNNQSSITKPNFLNYLKQLFFTCKRKAHYETPTQQIDLMQLYIKVKQHENVIQQLKSQRSLPNPSSNRTKSIPSSNKIRESSGSKDQKDLIKFKQEDGELEASLMTQTLISKNN